ncbi:hypothetical protein PFISCL1PPCAC_27422, partial [Pristionchus fissidentatus]
CLEKLKGANYLMGSVFFTLIVRIRRRESEEFVRAGAELFATQVIVAALADLGPSSESAECHNSTTWVWMILRISEVSSNAGGNGERNDQEEGK